MTLYIKKGFESIDNFKRYEHDMPTGGTLNRFAVVLDEEQVCIVKLLRKAHSEDIMRVYKVLKNI